MSGELVSYGAFGGYLHPYSTATSGDADVLTGLFSAREQELRQTVFGTRLAPVHQELEEIASSCSVPNWDSEGAARVKAGTLEEAAAFAEALPMWTPLPEVMADPRGHIGFEWDFGKSLVLVVTVSGQNRLTYAALLGKGARSHGVEIFSDMVPGSILGLLERLQKASKRARAERNC